MNARTRRNLERIVQSLPLLAAVLLCCAFTASAQTFSLTDLGPTGMVGGTTYYAGDGWEIQITGAAANAGVDMCDQSGCSYSGTCNPAAGYYGNTDTNGNLTPPLTGTFATNDSGYWSETWYVGCNAINPGNNDPPVTITFYVNPYMPPVNCVPAASPSPLYMSMTLDFYGSDWGQPFGWVYDLQDSIPGSADVAATVPTGCQVSDSVTGTYETVLTRYLQTTSDSLVLETNPNVSSQVPSEIDAGSYLGNICTPGPELSSDYITFLGVPLGNGQGGKAAVPIFISIEECFSP